MENTLGLDVHGRTTSASPSHSQAGDATESTASPRVQRREDLEDGDDKPEHPNATSLKAEDKNKKDKGKPYVPVAPPARAKMTPEELAERMEKIRLQNEKIKERREHVKADEEAFNTAIAAERAKQAANRKVQAKINQNREQNAKRKLERMGNREWDSGKQGGEWKQGKRPNEDKGRGNFFSLGSERDGGASHLATNTTGGSSPPTSKPVERPSRDAPHHIAKEHSGDSASTQPNTQTEGKHD